MLVCPHVRGRLGRFGGGGENGTVDGNDYLGTVRFSVGRGGDGHGGGNVIVTCFLSSRRGRDSLIKTKVPCL